MVQFFGCTRCGHSYWSSLVIGSDGLRLRVAGPADVSNAELGSYPKFYVNQDLNKLLCGVSVAEPLNPETLNPK